MWEGVDDDGFVWIEMTLSHRCAGDEDLLTALQVQQLLREWQEKFPQVHVRQWQERLGIQKESNKWTITCRRLQRLLARHRWCQTLCCCNPHRWLHNCCLEEKLNIGLNGQKKYLLQCGYCRCNVWGAVAIDWMHQATVFLSKASNAPHEQKMALAKQAYALALDATNAVVLQQSGDGYVDNAVLGGCLKTVGAAIYSLERADSNGLGMGYPTTLLPGWVSMTALRLGAPAELHMAWVLCEMRWVYDEREEETEEEKKEKEMTNKEQTKSKVLWLDRATRCCETIKRSIPNGSTQLAMRVECRLLQIYAMYPETTHTEVLSLVKAWPWKLEEWNAATCLSVCQTLHEQFGARYLEEEYLNRGVALNEPLFDELMAEWNGARDDDVEEWNTKCMEEGLSDEECVWVADQWLWEKKLLTPEVQCKISQAYACLGREEEAAAWLMDVDN